MKQYRSYRSGREAQGGNKEQLISEGFEPSEISISTKEEVIAHIITAIILFVTFAGLIAWRM